MSYALVFKDISILGDNNPATQRLGYHWVMWDIPAATTMLASGLLSGYESPSVSGAFQWSGRNNYGYFPPCPNPFPATDSRYTCTLTKDSYSYTLYAFDFTHLPSLPTPDLSATGEPTGNYVVNMAHYIESLSALAVTEYRGTSSAQSSNFPAPPALQYPCAADDKIDGGTNKKDGGVTIDGSALMCLE